MRCRLLFLSPASVCVCVCVCVRERVNNDRATDVLDNESKGRKGEKKGERKER